MSLLVNMYQSLNPVYVHVFFSDFTLFTLIYLKICLDVLTRVKRFILYTLYYITYKIIYKINHFRYGTSGK